MWGYLGMKKEKGGSEFHEILFTLSLVSCLLLVGDA